jgi:hypothetical protein
MDEGIMIGPIADPGQPGFEQLEFSVGELMRSFLQQKDCINLLFENFSGKEPVRDPNQKF